MKTSLIIAAGFIAVAGSASAWEGTAKACYGKVWSPAEYSVKEVLVKPAKTKWEHRNGQLVEMYYPPVYKEVKTQTQAAHWIMRKEACK